MFLAGLTNTLAVALPGMCLPVLFQEISSDLNLTLVQVGVIWGISALPGLFMSLIGGMIGDRLGPVRVLRVAVLLAAIMGALRGAATDYYSLAGMIFMYSLVSSVIPVNNVKVCGTWLPPRLLGIATSFLSMGMALGFIIGSLISATVLSPWLGSWRSVLYVYGGLTFLVGLAWFFTPATSPGHLPEARSVPVVSFRQALRQVVRTPNAWLLGIYLFGLGGCIQSTLGYLPLHLRSLAWSDLLSDSAVSLFHVVSLVFVIPIALLSAKIKSRKKILIGASLFVIAGIGLLSIGQTWLVWAAVLLAGFSRDGFMAVFTAMILESPGIGPAYAGTAFGFIMILSNLSNLLAPPIGNSLAAYGPGLPFLVWAGLGLFGLIALLKTHDTLPGQAAGNPG